MGLPTQAPQQQTPAMAWGLAHEPNMLGALLQSTTDIPMLARYAKVGVVECGLVFVNSAQLSAGVMAGMERSNLPAIAASPDAMVECFDSNGTVVGVLAAELKAPFPFVHNTAGNGGNYSYVGSNTAFSTVPAAYYAQCQVTMLATATSSCMLMQYTVEKTKVYMVWHDEAWCNEMLQLLVLLKGPWMAHMVGEADVAEPLVLDRLGRFASTTRDKCMAITVMAGVPSINGTDGKLFL